MQLVVSRVLVVSRSCPVQILVMSVTLLRRPSVCQAGYAHVTVRGFSFESGVTVVKACSVT